MTSIQAIVLGIMQGLGEFLPISSSAHLALAPYMFGWDYQGLDYDVMLHGGTLIAVLLYFAKDWYEIIKEAIFPFFDKNNKGKGIISTLKENIQQKPDTAGMLWLLIIATIPAGIFGVLLDDIAENIFRNPAWMGANLLFFSIFIIWADKTAKQSRDEKGLTLKHALIIGLAQCLALMPGASRSGMTIMAALFLGYSRPSAARFSFLLSTPVIGGAALLKALKFSAGDITLPFVLGILASFITGFAVIKFFMSWIKSKNLMPFMAYRIVLGVIILAYVILG